MAITIRHGQRYRARQVFSGASFTISRYEREHDPFKWMFVIDDSASDRAMEFDWADADMLAGELRQVDAGDLLPFEFESRLKRYFDETERQSGGRGPHIGTYTPPPPYRVFRVVRGSPKPAETSNAAVVDGDQTPTSTNPSHGAKVDKAV